MRPIRSITVPSVLASLVVLTSLCVAQDTAQDPVAALKQNLQASQAALKHYEWIETTTTVLKGEEKGANQVRCYPYEAAKALEVKSQALVIKIANSGYKKS